MDENHDEGLPLDPLFVIDLDDLAAEFLEQKDARVHSCKVCSLAATEEGMRILQLIEELILHGGGGHAISRFLWDRLQYRVSGTTIVTHARYHVVA